MPVLRGRTVLIVDDEPGVLEVLADLLAAEGLEVETAPDGQTALRKLLERAYDLVLSDLRMPGLDGPGLYRAATRHNPRLARCFVFMTGDVLTAETRTFLEDTRVPSLSKPFEVEELRATLGRALGQA